ncbi:hypothetical protein BS47DRAFT_1397061 [Hydnum rufescens UP504]|uniref:Uncharacterized protein n=1 Tax=Hydnum rufescens UP504 TaxID=1448309 RepID=A0A9P6DSA0_9AGAM|nr:hypothetical protein BS47DRAFT_1397061 [Hydnum rufescens UP504]
MPPKRTNMKTRKPTGKNSGSTSALAPSSDISSATPEPKSKLPKFKKKLADPLAAPPDPTPSTSTDPLRWDYGESSSPLSSEMIRSIQHFPTLCTRYSVYFEQNLNKVRGERPTSQRHFVSIQDWVLEYTNTLWESDASPDLLELLNPQPERIHRPRNLLFCGPPSVVSQFGETMHRYDFDPFYDVARAWSSPLTWAFFDKLCTRHMYTRNSLHVPYLPQHRFPFQEVVQRGSYALDFFLGCGWLITMRKALINAFDVYRLWLKAFQFFRLELDRIPVMEHGTHSDVAKALIESGQDGSLPGDAEQSFAKITAYREIVRIEDTLAEDPRPYSPGCWSGATMFWGRSQSSGAFISMDDPDVPMAELERHGVPLHGIRILEPREVRTLDPHAGDLSSESQAVANGVAERSPDEAHGEFMEIWRMKQGAQVKHLSLWMIRPIQQKEDYVHQQDVYTASVFWVLPPSASMIWCHCHLVLLPPPSPSRPDDMDVEPAVDAPVTSAVDAPALTTDPIHYFGFEGEEGYSSEEPSDDDFMKKCRRQSIKDWRLKEAQRDPPLGSSQQTDFPMAFLGIPGPREHILSIIRGGSEKAQRPPGYPKCAKKCRHSVNADQGPIDRPKSTRHEAKYGTLSRLVTVLFSHLGRRTVLSETVFECIALLPHSSLVLLVFSIPRSRARSPVRHSHSPPLVPHVFPAWVLAVLWVLLAVVHGLVIITHTLLAIICHLSITRILMNVACILVVAPLLLTVPCVLLLCDRHSGDRLPSLGPRLCSPMHHSPPPASPHVPPPDWDFPSVQGLHHDRPEPENAMLEDQAPEAQTVSQLPGPVSSDHDHDTSMQVDA